MVWAPMEMAFKPDAQTLLTVVASAEVGIPEKIGT